MRDFSNRKLPDGWYRPSSEEGASAFAEIKTEVPPGHRAYQARLELFAVRSGSEDVLLRYADEEDRFIILHLSWIGRQEIDARHPWVEFEGSFDEFLDEEERRFGMKTERG